MKRYAFILLIILSSALLFVRPQLTLANNPYPIPVYPRPSYSYETRCLESLAAAAKEFVMKDYQPPRLIAISIMAANDIHCQEPESMANIIIAVMFSPTKKSSSRFYYNLFHIHFSTSGQLISASYNNDLRWLPLEKADGWKDQWCDFLQNSIERYRDELAAQGCR